MAERGVGTRVLPGLPARGGVPKRRQCQKAPQKDPKSDLDPGEAAWAKPRLGKKNRERVCVPGSFKASTTALERTERPSFTTPLQCCEKRSEVFERAVVEVRPISHSIGRDKVEHEVPKRGCGPIMHVGPRAIEAMQHGRLKFANVE